LHNTKEKGVVGNLCTYLDVPVDEGVEMGELPAGEEYGCGGQPQLQVRSGLLS
jgi:hypothetical protein